VILFMENIMSNLSEQLANEMAGEEKQPAKRSRSKLPPRVTHYILIQPWDVYVVDATEVQASTTPDLDAWLPVVADSLQHAKLIGVRLQRRLTGQPEGYAKP
jgi:hypothetical protein